jgi:hypothetical protein
MMHAVQRHSVDSIPRYDFHIVLPDAEVGHNVDRSEHRRAHSRSGKTHF